MQYVASCLLCFPELQDKRLGEELCLLNDLLQLKLPVSARIAATDGPTRKKMTTELLWYMLREVRSKKKMMRY